MSLRVDIFERDRNSRSPRAVYELDVREEARFVETRGQGKMGSSRVLPSRVQRGLGRCIDTVTLYGWAPLRR